MTLPSSSFAEFLADVRAHQPAAIETFRRFTGRLLVLSANYLDPRLRRKVDPEDVLQSVLRSFFSRQARGQIVIRSWGELWGLLSVMTFRKCRRQARHYRRARRDLRREVESDFAIGREGLHDARLGWTALSREPTPSEAAMLGEAMELFLRDLPTRERDVLMLMLAGASVEAISQRLDRPERTVRRHLAQVRDRLSRRKHQ
jgi:RNA polymerase sigma-70 factor (ECF subfamily)